MNSYVLTCTIQICGAIVMSLWLAGASAQQEDQQATPEGDEVRPTLWDQYPEALRKGWGHLAKTTPVDQLAVLGEKELGAIVTLEILNLEPVFLNPAVRDTVSKSNVLKWLRLGSNVDNEDLPWISSLTGLRGLCLRDTDLKQANLRCFHLLAELTFLDLCDSELPLDPRGVIPKMASLKILRLSGVTITDSHVEEVAGLEGLYLGWTSVTDEGIETIANNNPDLVWLDLSKVTTITEKSIDSLSKLNNLKYLDISGTGIEKPALRRLMRLLPKCEIEIGT